MEKENPFLIFSTLHKSIEETERLCVDRIDELEVCFTALSLNYQNVLLYGTRGVGKTFLVNLLENRLKKELPAAFVAYISIQNLIPYGNPDPIASFSRATLLQVCSKIWTELLGKSYLDLREKLDKSVQAFTIKSSTEKTIQKIYSLLMRSEIQSIHQFHNTVGLNKVVKVEHKKIISKSFQQSDILPFEFAELADEIMVNVLKPEKKDRLIILCDEANKMDLFQQEAILERYFDLFNTKQIQFLFVAGFMPGVSKMGIPSCFETEIELEGLPNKSYLKELIENVNHRPIKFTNDAVEILFDHFNGHPLFSMKICSQVYYQCIKEDTNIIDGPLINRFCNNYKKEQKQREIELMKFNKGI